MKAHTHGGDIFSAEQDITLDYSANLNPLGMPLEVKQTIVNHVDDFQRYPDPYCRELRNALSVWESVPMDWIICGNGASDLILRVAQAVQPKKTLVPAPTFSEYEKAVRPVGSEVIYYDLKRENGFVPDRDILDALTEDVDLFFLCNPNNPTGVLLSEHLLKDIVSRCKEQGIFLVMDECFLDFTDGISCKQWLATNDSLLILKAFTKMFSMAGLRMGYGICANREMLEEMERWGQSWSVSSPAQYAGLAACQCENFVKETRAFVKSEREWLTEQLRKAGLQVYNGTANYLFFSGPKQLWQRMMEQGVLIRNCGNYRGLNKGDYRICVKTRKENKRFLELLQVALMEIEKEAQEWQNR